MELSRHEKTTIAILVRKAIRNIEKELDAIDATGRPFENRKRSLRNKIKGYEALMDKVLEGERI